MTTLGFVLQTDGTRASVSTSRTGACGHCSERGACGVDGGGSARSEVVTAENPIGARPGDLVELHLATGTAMRLSALIWLLPLAGLVGGGALGASLHERVGLGEDAGVLIGAVVGMAAAFGLLRIADRRAAGDQALVPTIAKIVQNASCPTGG